jgi:hypothetical protein
MKMTISLLLFELNQIWKVHLNAINLVNLSLLFLISIYGIGDEKSCPKYCASVLGLIIFFR